MWAALPRDAWKVTPHLMLVTDWQMRVYQPTEAGNNLHGAHNAPEPLRLEV